MIYFVRETGNQYIKIGTAIDVASRTKGLQTANPRKLHVKAILEGSHQTEKELHKLFEKSNVRGEWFKFNDDIKFFVRAIQENPQTKNIYSLCRKSQEMRIRAKAKRLGTDHKLSKRIKKIEETRYSS